jgi:CRISPR/Cas system-associated protein Csx1|tara:strand:- start:201 stop:377 length:177 start_codon:yes stop_codon:yes gene_type:complete
MNDKEKIEKVSKLFGELESMIRIRNREIRIKPTYDPTEEYSFTVYLALIDKIKKILEK